MRTKNKNRFIHIVFIISILTITSCDDYLSVVPKGQKIPTTLSDFALMLKNEYTCQRVDAAQTLILLNDRYVTVSNLNYYPLYKANYNWDESADRIDLNKSDEMAYYSGYAAISTFNLIIQNAPGATEANDAERNMVKAQSKVLRAMSYFNLVNYYSDTYVASTAASKGGVPLITSADVNAAHTQPSVQEIYDFILQDMQEAYNYLPETGETILHPDKATADAFYARLYLQMGNYDQALIHADKALAAHSALFNWITFYDSHKTIIEDPANYSTLLPSPMGFDYIENYNFRHGSISSYQSSENSVPLERMEKFEEGDARAAARWKFYIVGTESYYRSSMTGYYNYGGMTTTEVYLIKAECLARSGQYAEAMDMVNSVRETRILPDHYQPFTATTEAEAMTHIIQTKGNEMIMTQVPFMDARRLNAEGKYPVTRSKVTDGITLTLSPTSHLWTMPFPQGAVKNPGNGTITQNVSK